MARIQYDRYLQDVDELIVVTNTDSERAVDVVPESFENPTIKFRILDVTNSEDPLAAFDISDTSTSETVYRELQGRVKELVNGQIPGWRLIGVEFSPMLLEMYYVNPRTTGEETCGDIKYDTATVYCIDCTDNWSITMELEVDYGDGLPSRRYIAKMKLDDIPRDNTLRIAIDEYYGRRKVRRLEFTEGEETTQGQLCHITEY